MKIFIKPIIVVLFSICLNYTNTYAQLIINNTSYVTPTAAQSLIQNVLLGQGVQAFNFSFTGHPAQIAFFKNINTNLGIDSGIVMSTGDVNGLAVPASTLSSTAFNSSIGDPDLLSILQNSPIATQAVNDVAILEFDFIPLGDSVKFDYVFGSEEYPDFVCDFNDVFGLFISGPGINGPYSNNAENIALVPTTGQEVSITTINDGDSNGSCPWAPQNNQFYVDNSSSQAISFDAFTTLLTAKTQVICGDTFHVKMVLCDAGDWSYDSGIFLRAKSFVSAAVSINPTTLTGDSAIVEGCSTGSFTFYRPGNTTDSLVIVLDVSGTAIEGVDYNFLPDSLIFVPGQSIINLPITPFSDGVVEGPESIIVDYTQNICGQVTLNSSLWIVPISPVTSYSYDTATSCPGAVVEIAANYTGGYPPYTVVWSTGETTNGITVSPIVTTTYYYSVTDICYGLTVQDSVTVIVPAITPLSVSGVDACLEFNTSGQLTANASGGIPPYTFTWYQNGFLFDFGQTISIFGTVPTWYVVEVSDGCGGIIASDSTEVSIGIPVTIDVVTADPNQQIVEGCEQGSFVFTRPGINTQPLNLPITISGSAINGTDYSIINDTITFAAGQSQVTVSVYPLDDALIENSETIVISYVSLGCANTSQVSDTMTIYPIVDIAVVTQGQTALCEGNNVLLEAFSGTVGTYQWQLNGLTIPGATNNYFNANNAGNYAVTVTKGICSATSGIVTMNAQPIAPVITSSGPLTFCNGDDVTLYSSYTAGNTWSNGANSSSINVNNSGTYFVVVTDSNNCSSTSNMVVVQALNTPTFITQPSDQTGLLNGTVNFTVDASGASNFQWQIFTPTGFQDISIGGQYTGTTNDTLTVSGLSMQNNNQFLRCIITNGACSDTSSIVLLTVNPSVNTNFFESKNIDISFYPNPAQNIVYADFSMCQSTDNFRIQLTNVMGQHIFSEPITQKITAIDTQTIGGSGLYFVSVLNCEGKVIQISKLAIK